MISHSRRCHRVLAVILRETMIPLVFGLAVSILAALPLNCIFSEVRTSRWVVTALIVSQAVNS
jgi:hypothetical protein